LHWVALMLFISTGRFGIARCLRPVGLAVIAILVVVAAAACFTDPSVKKQTFLESGDRYFKEGQYRHAVIEYRNAIAIDARFGQARSQLAETYVRLGEPSNALSEYVRAADLLPNDFDLQIKAGAYQLAARQADQALVRADAALKLRPKDIDAHILRANALSGRGAADLALEAIGQAVALDPNRAPTFTNKGLIEMAHGRNAEAEGSLKKAIALAPQAVEPHLALGQHYWSLGRADATEQALRDVRRKRSRTF
jgi:Tfp pilus assembly protein PilF